MDAQTFLNTLRLEILNPEEHIDLPWLNKELERLGKGIVPIYQFIDDGEPQTLLTSPEAREIVDMLLDTQLSDRRRRQRGIVDLLNEDERWLRQTLKAINFLINDPQQIETLLTGALLQRMAIRRSSQRLRKFERLIIQIIADTTEIFGKSIEFIPKYEFQLEKELFSQNVRVYSYDAAVLHRGRPILAVDAKFINNGVMNQATRKSLIQELFDKQRNLARSGVSLLVIADGPGFRAQPLLVKEMLSTLPYCTNLYGAIDEIPRAIDDAIANLPEIDLALSEAQYADIEARITRLLRAGQEIIPALFNVSVKEAREFFVRYRTERSYYSYKIRDDGVIEATNAPLVRTINEIFDNTERMASANSKPLMTMIVDHLGYSMELISQHSGYDLFGLYLPEGRLFLPRPFPVAVITGASLAQRADILRMLDRELSSGKIISQIAIAIETADGQPARLAAERLRSHGRTQITVLDRNDVVDLLLHTPSGAQKYLRRLMFANIDRSKTSPFQLNGPVSEAQFYGRDLEIRQVIEGIRNRSFALVGGRKAGKTSILQRLLPQLDQRYKVVYLDCQARTDRESLLRYLIERTQPALRVINNPQIDHTDEILRAFVQSEFGNAFGVFLIDEVDAVFGDDAQSSNYRHILSSALRSLSQAQRATMVVTGERTLSELTRDPSSPHWNFATQIRIGPLQEGAARQLLREPIDEIGLEISEGALDLALRQTACHPNLLQEIGNRAVEQASYANPTVEIRDIEIISASPAYQSTFVGTFWSQATVLEKYLSVQFRSDVPLDIERLAERLSEVGISRSLTDIQRALAFLELYTVIRKEAAGYVLAAPAFDTYLNQEATPFVCKQWEKNLQ